jgi:hypothetical protein
MPAAAPGLGLNILGIRIPLLGPAPATPKTGGDGLLGQLLHLLW